MYAQLIRNTGHGNTVLRPLQIKSNRQRKLLIGLHALHRIKSGIVDKPGEYAWSSYRHHVNEQVACWIIEPEEFLRLAASVDLRAEAYRELFKEPLKVIELEQIRNHLNKNCALGSDKFQKEIEAVSGRRVEIVKQGRPRKRVDGY